MRTWEPNSVDAIITDPPYGIGFMGAAWDTFNPDAIKNRNIQKERKTTIRTSERYPNRMSKTSQGAGPSITYDETPNGNKRFQAWVESWAVETLRVLKPGGHAVVFGGPRTFHRVVCGFEDAGFEIRDVMTWLYASGYPKSRDVSKAIDGYLGAKREVVGVVNRTGKVTEGSGDFAGPSPITVPSTPEAKQWDGWGTALKPAHEPILLARKPLDEKAERYIIAENLLRLEAKLWSLLPASIAINHLKSSQADYDAACDFAAWSAEERRSTLDGLCDPTDMQWFVSMASTCLNTVTSWNNILAEDWKLKNTSIIEKKGSNTGQIIDWKILKSFLSEITPRIIIQAAMEGDGSKFHALPVARLFRAASLNIHATRDLSVLANVIDLEHIRPQDETGLTPNWEPILIARKPLVGNVAQNVIAYGTGGINIDACLIPFSSAEDEAESKGKNAHGDYQSDEGAVNTYGDYSMIEPHNYEATGRWPANLLFDEDAALILGRNSRFFFSGKVSRTERNAGMKGAIEQPLNWSSGDKNPGAFQSDGTNRMVLNGHPTVKPLSVMRWLVRLITPPGGIVVDLFGGSGTTICACQQEGVSSRYIDTSAEYAAIADRRIRWWGRSRQPELF